MLYPVRGQHTMASASHVVSHCIVDHVSSQRSSVTPLWWGSPPVGVGGLAP